MSTRVVVVGSGAAGLAAALAASGAGAEVVIVERAERAGGTTALSGGNAWLPGFHGDTSCDDAKRYLEVLGLGDYDAALCDVYVDSAARVGQAIEEGTALRWKALDHPDYHAELPGAAQGGRAFDPQPTAVDPAVAALVRDAPMVTAPITYEELISGEIDWAAVEQRRRDGVLTLGRALVGALLQALLERGVELRLGTRARSLVHGDGGVVAGLRTDADRIEGNVVLASGGFERDPGLVRAYLRGPMTAPAGVPTNEGDGLRMAIAAGAALGNMSDAWWAPATRIPGERIDDAEMFRVILFERARPGSIIVDRAGRRFADEAQNYNDFGRSLHGFDAASFSFTRDPAWMIFDGAYRRRYSIGPIRRKSPDPDWLLSAPTPAALAASIDVPAANLEATIERFNGHAAAGRDPDFGRGDYAFDRLMGDDRAEHPVLAPLAEPPFYALRLVPGCLGTKGGPRTDELGRVLRADSGAPIDGLFAAGNVAANPFGYGYPGGGGTIGPALVFGFRAGEAAAG
jgi:succinate dehydrogenase/fumarate reductase flavoprotein subunit